MIRYEISRVLGTRAETSASNSLFVRLARAVGTGAEGFEVSRLLKPELTPTETPEHTVNVTDQ